VIAAPVLTVATSDGTVGYRSVGSGPPLVMIMGFGGSIDSWQPSFVDALAARYRVITLDNAGVGLTTALPAPLTMTAMAAQTSAFITALHLGAPDVLGWSMGGMIAQALAVTHPDQIHKLVLCATLSGDGKATLPSAKVIALLEAPSGSAGLTLLFPSSQVAAEAAFVTGLLSYPHPYAASKAAVATQEAALSEWSLHPDPVGSRISSIAVPTLVADGTVDPLIPLPNDDHLAATIPHAQLAVYPGAAHAFLFQDQTTFLPRLESFLG